MGQPQSGTAWSSACRSMVSWTGSHWGFPPQHPSAPNHTQSKKSQKESLPAALLVVIVTLHSVQRGSTSTECCCSLLAVVCCSGGHWEAAGCDRLSAPHGGSGCKVGGVYSCDTGASGNDQFQRFARSRPAGGVFPTHPPCQSAALGEIFYSA